MVNDLDDDPAQETAAAIRAAGGEAIACAGSVTAPDFAERFVGTAVGRYKGLDIIVNNAGYTWDNVIQKMTDEQWDAMLDVHLTAPFRILRAAAGFIRQASRKEAEAGQRRLPQGRQHLVARRRRRQCRPGQLRGGEGRRHRPDHDAGQGVGPLQGQRQLRRLRPHPDPAHRRRPPPGAAIDVDGRQIEVGVNPDLLQAVERMVPLGRGGTPEEAAGAVYLFCTPESNYISGQTIVCGGGFMM